MRCGVLDRSALEQKFGIVDPFRLLEELQLGEKCLSERLQDVGSEQIEEELVELEEWHRKANGRLRTMKKRAAWAVLGIDWTQDQAAIRRAFKKKALELHPDKGGDANHFQLLQEMKDVLLLSGDRLADSVIGVTPEHGGATGRNAKRGKEHDNICGGCKDQEEQGKDGDVESESELSENELEFRKLRQKAHCKDGSDAFSWMDDAQKDRAKLEARRKRMHRVVMDTWARASSLATDVGVLGSVSAGCDAVNAMRSFVDRFARTELAMLQQGGHDPVEADRLFWLFLNQGLEVLCVAGTLDPESTVSAVAMKVNLQLLALAGDASPVLKRRCAKLLEAIRCLPKTYESFVDPIDNHSLKKNQQTVGDENRPSWPEVTSDERRAELVPQVLPPLLPPQKADSASMLCRIGDGDSQASRAVSSVHEPGCRCMQCIRRRQFGC